MSSFINCLHISIYIRGNLSILEYENYGKMYQAFQRLLATYDTEPDNVSRYVECNRIELVNKVLCKR